MKLDRLTLAAASLILSLLAAELALRVIDDGESLPPMPAPQTIDPYSANPYILTNRPYLQQFIPGARFRIRRDSYTVDYRINSHGFRGPEIGSKQARRLVVVGDSIPEGQGVAVSQTFVARLHRALAPHGWEVVSAAMQGGSPLSYAANLPRTLVLDPDAVLLLLYENDLWDDRRQEANYFEMPEQPPAGGLALWTLMRPWVFPAPESPVEHLVRENRTRLIAPNDEEGLGAVVVSAEELPQQWRMSRAYLDLLADALVAREIPLLVSTLAMGTLSPRAPLEYGRFARGFEVNTQQWSKARALPFRSLFAVPATAFEQLPWEEILIPDDGHPTAEMHRRFALHLMPWLAENLPASRGPRPPPKTQAEDPS